MKKRYTEDQSKHNGLVWTCRIYAPLSWLNGALEPLVYHEVYADGQFALKEVMLSYNKDE